jgi:hypothetical protein
VKWGNRRGGGKKGWVRGLKFTDSSDRLPPDPSIPPFIHSSLGRWMAVVGLLCVFVAFIGNVMDNAEVLPYFVSYYAVILALCFTMFQRVRVLKARAFLLASR